MVLKWKLPPAFPVTLLLFTSAILTSAIGSFVLINEVNNNNVTGNAGGNFDFNTNIEAGQDFVFQIQNNTFSNKDTATFRFLALKTDGSPIYQTDINEILSWSLNIYNKNDSLLSTYSIDRDNIIEENGNYYVTTQPINFSSTYVGGEEYDATIYWEEVGSSPLEQGPFESIKYSFVMPEVNIPNIIFSAGYQGVHQGTANFVVKYDDSITLDKGQDNYLFNRVNLNIKTSDGNNEKIDVLKEVQNAYNDNSNWMTVDWDPNNHQYSYTFYFDGLEENKNKAASLDLEAQYNYDVLQTAEIYTAHTEINTRDKYESPELKFNGITYNTGLEIDDWRTVNLDFSLLSNNSWPKEVKGFGRGFELEYKNNINRIKIFDIFSSDGSQIPSKTIENNDWGKIDTVKLDGLKPGENYTFSIKAELKSDNNSVAIKKDKLELENQVFSTRGKSIGPVIEETSFVNKQTDGSVNQHEAAFTFDLIDKDGGGYDYVGSKYVEKIDWELYRESDNEKIHFGEIDNVLEKGNTIPADKLNNLEANTDYRLEIRETVKNNTVPPSIFTKSFTTNKNKAIDDSEFIVNVREPIVDEGKNTYNQKVVVNVGEHWKNIETIELIDDVGNVIDTESSAELVELNADDLTPGETYNFSVRLKINNDTDQPTINPKPIGSIKLGMLAEPSITSVKLSDPIEGELNLKIDYDQMNNIKSSEYKLIDISDPKNEKTILTESVDKSYFTKEESGPGEFERTFDSSIIEQQAKYRVDVSIESIDLAPTPIVDSMSSNEIWTKSDFSKISDFNVVSKNNLATITYQVTNPNNIRKITYKYTYLKANGTKGSGTITTNDIPGQYITKKIMVNPGNTIQSITVSIEGVPRDYNPENPSNELRPYDDKEWNLN